MSDGSGDYVIAFSTHTGVRRTPVRRSKRAEYEELPNDQVSPLFLAGIEAVEEAIYNSLCMAVSVTGYQGNRAEALPLERVEDLARARG
jgi:D-aminopeptidase